MKTIGLDDFIEYIGKISNKELLLPSEASKLQLMITELLVENKVDMTVLKFLSRFFTQQTYDEVIEERNIEHECGYILCGSSPHERVRRLSSNGNGTVSSSQEEPGSYMKYQIYNRKPSIILPNTYLSKYCCKKHYQASLFYRNQLSQEAIFARKDIMLAPPFPQNYSRTWYENGITCLEEVLEIHNELKDQGKTLGDVITMMSGLSVAESAENNDTKDLIKLIEDLEIVEKEAKIDEVENDNSAIMSDEDTSTQSRGVDGYITTNRSFGGHVV